MNQPSPMTVLTVCTGNICRSPAAERLLAASFGPSVQVSSAGTGAVVGHDIEHTMAHLLDNAGIATGDFAARQITEDIIRNSSLILTMTREHRSNVVELVPEAVRRTYTLREFARIAAEAPPATINHATTADCLRHLVSIAPHTRPLVRSDSGDDDVPDPFKRSLELFTLAYDLIREAVDMIATRVVVSLDTTQPGLKPAPATPAPEPIAVSSEPAAPVSRPETPAPKPESMPSEPAPSPEPATISQNHISSPSVVEVALETDTDDIDWSTNIWLGTPRRAHPDIID